MKKADEIVESLKGSGWGGSTSRRKKDKGLAAAPSRRHLPGGKSFRRNEEDMDLRTMLDRSSPRMNRSQLHVDTALPSAAAQRRSPPPITYEAILALASEINEDNTSPPPSTTKQGMSGQPVMATPKTKRSPSFPESGSRRENKLDDESELAAFFNKKKKENLEKQWKKKN